MLLHSFMAVVRPALAIVCKWYQCNVYIVVRYVLSDTIQNATNLMNRKETTNKRLGQKWLASSVVVPMCKKFAKITNNNFPTPCAMVSSSWPQLEWPELPNGRNTLFWCFQQMNTKNPCLSYSIILQRIPIIIHVCTGVKQGLAKLSILLYFIHQVPPRHLHVLIHVLMLLGIIIYF